MKISHILARAAKLVERGWHRGWMAVTHNGEETDPKNPQAVAWCLIGAVQRVTKCADEERKPVFEFLEEFLGTFLIASWNDAPRRTGPEVACWLSSCAQYAEVLGK